LRTSWPYSNSVWSVGLTTILPLKPSSSAYSAVGQISLAFLKSDDGGDAQRARHDGGVRGAAADVGGEAEDHFRSICAVLDGVRSCAMMMHGSVEVREVEVVVAAEQIIRSRAR
jgi:hypothetical protein